MPGGVNDIWSVVVPQAGTNYVTNPSFELDTSGWAQAGSTFARVSGQTIGVSCLQLTASAPSGRADSAVLLTAPGGQAYTVSGWIAADTTQAAVLLYDNTLGAPIATAPYTGSAYQWRRVSATATPAAGHDLKMLLIDNRTSAWTPVYFDGIQLEAGSVATTYIDGDQPGCTWTGAPHRSISTRDGQDTHGGAITTFETAGLFVSDQGGIGAPDIAISTQQLALSDGAIFQRSTAKERVFSLTARIFGTGTSAGLHAARRTVMAAFASAFGLKRGPTVLRYTGSATPRTIEAYYEGGLGLDKVEGADEVVALRFRAPDPCFYDEMDMSAPLATVTLTGATSMVARRNVDGSYDTLDGGLQTPPGHAVFCMAAGLDGTVYVGGNNFTRVDGGVGTRLLQWDPVSGAWSRVGSLGDPNADVDSMAIHPGTGDLYISGTFTQIGASSFSRIARYDRALGTWNALGTGLSAFANSLAFDSAGNLHAAGSFATAGGVASANAAYWNGTSWVANTTGTTANLRSLTEGPDGMYCTNTALILWRGPTAWTGIGAVLGGGGSFSSIRWYKGWLYATGSFTSIDGVPAGGVARYANGTWEGLGSLLSGGNPFGSVHLADGTLIAWGSFTSAGGITTPAGLAQWDGSQWWPVFNSLPYSSLLNGISALVADRAGNLTFSFASAGTAAIPGIVTVTNGGTAPAYPVIELTGSANLLTLENMTTGQVIKFSSAFVYPSETVRLDLRPGAKTFKSVTNGRDLMPTVLPTSDFSTFALAPGANRISLYVQAFGSTGSIRYRPRYWSSD
jgi:hypothetical protein